MDFMDEVQAVPEASAPALVSIIVVTFFTGQASCSRVVRQARAWKQRAAMCDVLSPARCKCLFHQQFFLNRDRLAGLEATARIQLSPCDEKETNSPLPYLWEAQRLPVS